ncbi:MAG: ATP phosphoribosyltransferase [Clostridiales bacterium]|nr:ATP phosphoribosyltransferase [Candidatus Equinaster intestinalis]
MQINDSVLQNSEKIIFSLRELYASFGYTPYRMGKFEEYDLYANNKDFLVSDNVITFTDNSGKLMALKPDVTLSIIKNSSVSHNETQKVFYNENVYRKSKSTDSFKEIMQVGVECFGKVGKDEICEVITLAANSLKKLSGDAILAVSDLSIITSLVDSLCLKSDVVKKLYNAIGEKNLHEIDLICNECENKSKVEALKKLISINGKIEAVLPILKELSADLDTEAYANFTEVLKVLTSSEMESSINIDFSVIGNTSYYNGIIFNGFIRDLPDKVLSGGQYDCLMQKFDNKSSAIGFAVYMDLLDRLSEDTQNDDGYLNIALPKGRLGEKVYDIFAKAGYECPQLLEQGRKLIFENDEKKLRYFWVKPSDVAIYVERGAADIGVAGKDILLEYSPEVYELLDLKKGKCRMAVAAPNGFEDDTSKTLRVATKFSNIAKSYYMSKGRDIDIIHLNGSIEIAPILKLSDVIVDIVETGTTLKENNLSVFEEVVPISARLISNKSSYKFKAAKIEEITKNIKAITEEEQ